MSRGGVLGLVETGGFDSVAGGDFSSVVTTTLGDDGDGITAPPPSMPSWSGANAARAWAEGHRALRSELGNRHVDLFTTIVGELSAEYELTRAAPVLHNLLHRRRDRGDQSLCEQARMAVFRQRLAFKGGRDEAGALLQATQCAGKLFGELLRPARSRSSM